MSEGRVLANSVSSFHPRAQLNLGHPVRAQTFNINYNDLAANTTAMTEFKTDIAKSFLENAQVSPDLAPTSGIIVVQLVSSMCCRAACLHMAVNSHNHQHIACKLLNSQPSVPIHLSYHARSVCLE